MPVRTLWSALSFVALWGGPAAAGPNPRDEWHAYVADGKRYGSVHTVVTRLQEGNFRYAVEGRLLLDILGAHKEEITWRREYVVTPAYRPVSFRAAGSQSSGASRASGVVRDGKLEVKALRDR